MTEKGRFTLMLIIAIIGCVAAVVSTVIALIQFEQRKAAQTEADEANKLAIVERNKRLEAESALRKELEKERDRFRRFEREYRDHLESLKAAKREYQTYDSEVMRLELPEKELKRRQEDAFRDLKTSVRAFIDFVGKWREVQDALKSLINSVADQLKRDTQDNNRQAIIDGIDVIVKKSEGDMTVLENALDRALEEKSSGK
jgi:membrane-associated HD superfamily phosphohydrolase